MIYGFFLVGERGGIVSIRRLETLASWASRYGIICVAMRPFTIRLYAAQKCRNWNDSVALTDDLWRICRLLQALLVLSVFDRLQFSRLLAAFALQHGLPTVAAEHDASLIGGGGLIFVCIEGAERLIGCFDVDLTSMWTPYAAAR